MTEKTDPTCPTASGLTPPTSEAPVATPSRRPKRWSAARKRELVMRLFRGESLDHLSRETGLAVHRIAQWRDEASAAMEQALKASNKRSEGDLETDKRELQRKLGAVTMEAELLQAQVDKLKAAVPFAQRGRWKR